MAQPSISSFFITRKRGLEDDALQAKNKVVCLEKASNSTEESDDSEELKTKVVFPKAFDSSSTDDEPKKTVTKPATRQGITPQRRTRSKKLQMQEVDGIETAKVVNFWKGGNLSPQKKMKQPEKSSLTSELNEKLIRRKIDKEIPSASSQNEPVEKIPLLSTNNMNSEKIKQKLKSSSKLTELKTKINKLRDGLDKIDRMEEKRLENASLKEKKEVESTAKTLKPFKSIELEILSPKKRLCSPFKLKDSPMKNTVMGSPKIITPKRLFSPTKSMTSPLKSSPIKAPAYQRFQNLAEAGTPTLQLPFKYRYLLEIFKAVDTICAMFFNRKEKITFKKMKPAVQRIVRKNFYESHLAQIHKLMPNAFKFAQEKTRNFGSTSKQDYYQLVITPIIGSPKDEVMQLTLSPQILIERTKKMTEMLTELVFVEHEKFLQALENPISVTRGALKHWHPEFDLENCPDVEHGNLPKPPNEEKFSSANAILSTARNLFHCSTPMERALERLEAKKKEEKPKQQQNEELQVAKMKAIPDRGLEEAKDEKKKISSEDITSSLLKGVSKSLLDKIRAKQAAKALDTMTRRPSQEREAAKFASLPEIARHARNIFVTEKKGVLPLEMLSKKMQNSYKATSTLKEIEELMRIISNVLPLWLSFHEIRNTMFVKLNLMNCDNYVNFYNFSCDYETPETTRKLNLYFYPRDNSLELYDVGSKRLFLKRTVISDVALSDIYIGARLTIYGKNIMIRDYGNSETRRLMNCMKQRAFLMVMPEAKRHVGAIISSLERQKLFIKQLKMLKLQALSAVQFCESKTSDENLSLLMDNITSGYVVVIEVLGENAIEQLKKICGPDEVDDAKANFPSSFRAQYGIDNIKCGVLYPKDSISNQKDLEFFFPKINDRWKVQANFHRSTLCLIKPHAVKEGKIGEILKMIVENNFTITAMKMVHLDRKQSEEFYEIYKGVVGEYLQMVTQLQSGSCLAIEIQSEDDEVQAKFRAFCGPADPLVGKILRPQTLRAAFGTDKAMNAVHCTDLREDTMLETGLTFNDLLPENAKSYDKMRPPKKDGQATTVFFHVTVMGLDSIDETSMTYAADIFFAQTWKDHRLRLPENMTSEYRLLEVEWLKNMWRPDSFFKNAKSVTFQTMTIPNHYMWLYKDKTILYMVKLTLRLSCAMNFMIYPHDTQECKLQMESLSHTTADMIFQWDPDVPLVVDENIELPQLALIKNYTADCTQVYSTGNFTCLEVVFVLKRRLGYYLFHTYIPTCLIVIMSWVSFWIKPEAAPARVTLGVTSLLTLSTQHAKSQASLPPVSYLKAVDAFMSVCTVFVFMALMEYCLVNIVLGDNPTPKMNGPPKPPPPPPSEPKLDKILEYASKFSRNPSKNGRRDTRCSQQGELTDSPHPYLNQKRNYTSENLITLSDIPPAPPRPVSKITPAQIRLRRAIHVDKFSRVAFPLTFALLNCTYWYMFYEYI
ncbi:CLUMA_CG011991, isoform A [Clunio marinus]|uniref:CLUMA_CG011991, isoform A n=1 Tax=Clunio marinus TaxID=568069 RepID=A0A1J1IF71_9DIPT|nr:CLUMA_CG011991, isoform A [Clunio marinus]